jgi:hypothetical protein
VRLCGWRAGASGRWAEALWLGPCLKGRPVWAGSLRTLVTERPVTLSSMLVYQRMLEGRKVCEGSRFAARDGWMGCSFPHRDWDGGGPEGYGCMKKSFEQTT